MRTLLDFQATENTEVTVQRRETEQRRRNGLTSVFLCFSVSLYGSVSSVASVPVSSVFSVAAGAQIDAPRITQQDFKKLIAAKNVIIVDTRNEDEFPLGHIPGAIKLPLEGQMTWPASYEKTVATLMASKKPIVTYCA